MGRFVIDIVRGEQLIEIQTRNFGALKHKFSRLLETHAVHLVYPIAREKWIVQISPEDESVLSRRKSPKTGKLSEVFRELLRIPEMINHPDFTLEVLLVQEEEIRCADGQGSWRRKHVSIRDRRLLEVLERVEFNQKFDFLRFLPEDLTEPFTNKILSQKLKMSIYQVRRMSYCMRKMGIICETGKKGNELLFAVCQTNK